jgi:hypothetical protein
MLPVCKGRAEGGAGGEHMAHGRDILAIYENTYVRNSSCERGGYAPCWWAAVSAGAIGEPAWQFFSLFYVGDDFRGQYATVASRHVNEKEPFPFSTYSLRVVPLARDSSRDSKERVYVLLAGYFMSS